MHLIVFARFMGRPKLNLCGYCGYWYYTLDSWLPGYSHYSPLIVPLAPAWYFSNTSSTNEPLIYTKEKTKESAADDNKVSLLEDKSLKEMTAWYNQQIDLTR